MARSCASSSQWVPLAPNHAAGKRDQSYGHGSGAGDAAAARLIMTPNIAGEFSSANSANS